jgi:CAAX protease family protein
VTRAQPSERASPGLLAAALAAYSLAHLFNNTVLALPRPKAALLQLQSASGGWIEPVLVRSQVVLAVFLAVVVLFGRRRMADLGWRPRHVLPGLVTYFVAWCGLQLGLVLLVLRQGGELAWHPMWLRFGIGAVAGGVLAQAFGHALVEDTAFRAFFLPELRKRLLGGRTVLAGLGLLVLALLGSAALFGLAHLPTRLLVMGTSLGELAREQVHFLSAGLALGAAWLATRNLFAVVGLHVLLNDPAPLVDVPGTVLNRAVLVVFGGVVVLASLRRWRLWRERRRAGAPQEADGVRAEPRRAA